MEANGLPTPAQSQKRPFEIESSPTASVEIISISDSDSVVSDTSSVEIVHAPVLKRRRVEVNHDVDSDIEVDWNPALALETPERRPDPILNIISNPVSIPNLFPPTRRPSAVPTPSKSQYNPILALLNNANSEQASPYETPRRPTRSSPPFENFGISQLDHFEDQDAPSPAIASPSKLNSSAWKQYGRKKGDNGRDFSLRYDDDSPGYLSNAEPAASADDFRTFVKEVSQATKNVPTVEEARKHLDEANMKKHLRPFKLKLHPYQLIGVSWLLRQEKEKMGGLLGDDMGLGKTIQMIALILMNQPERPVEEDKTNGIDFSQPFTRTPTRPAKKDMVPRTTLIIVPAAIVTQWKEEFGSVVKAGTLRVRVHHGKERLRTREEVEQCDVVITTPDLVRQDFMNATRSTPAKDYRPGATPNTLTLMGSPRKKPRQSTDRSFKKCNNKDMERYRIILDEAQIIRNKETQISKIVVEMDAKYRWLLTGTPITNTLADLFGFIRFLKIRPWNDWDKFNHEIAKVQLKNPQLAGERAKTILKVHMLRRNKEDLLNGKPLFELTQKSIEFEELNFSPQERTMYKDVEAAAKEKILDLIVEGDVIKKYHYILLMILRLRQICSHPNLVKDKSLGINKDLKNDKAARKEELKNILESKGQEFIDRMRLFFSQRLRASADGSYQMECCSSCREPLDDESYITSCMHEFCYDCTSEMKSDKDTATSYYECTRCNIVCQLYTRVLFQDQESDADETEQTPVSAQGIASTSQPSHTQAPADSPLLGDSDDEDFFLTPPNRNKGKQRADVASSSISGIPFTSTSIARVATATSGDGEAEPGLDPADVPNIFLAKVPSAKVKALLTLLEEWRLEAPEDRVIVYSQWTSFIDIMAPILHDRKIKYLRFDGKMKQADRNDALVKFKEDNGPKVMFVSLKCGGVGLNLVRANRVVLLDLAWNWASEAQAIDRVHRMGQKKDVIVRRLIVKDTIEERVVRLQGAKLELSEAALGSGTGGQGTRWTEQQIATLFNIENKEYQQALRVRNAIRESEEMAR